MSSEINEHEIRIVGLSRSGNHAIINWLLGQLPGRYCFLNCVEPRTNPYESARPMDDGSRVVVNYDGFDLNAEARGQFSPKDYLVFNYEDCFLKMVTSREFEDHHDALVGPSRRRYDLLILRDPFNLIASRFKAGLEVITPLTSARIWKQHARQFLGQRRFLPQEFVPVSYNAWATDVDYRRQLAERLEVPFSDAGFHSVPATAGGSSFDGTEYDGAAERMRVFRRWKHFQHDPEYRRLFDEDVLELAAESFGTVDPSPDFADFFESLAAERLVSK